MRVPSGWVALSLSLPFLAVVDASEPSAGTGPQRGATYFGATSQGKVAVAKAARDGRLIRRLEVDVVSRCVSPRVGRDLSTVTLQRLPVRRDGRFARSGRLDAFNEGPDEAGSFPVVVTGRLTGRFRSRGRLTGTARFVLRGRFFLGGSEGEGFDSQRTTCRSGLIRFSAAVPRDARSRHGSVRELPGRAGCLFSQGRRGCGLVPSLRNPLKILLSRDGRHAYVLSETFGGTPDPERRVWLLAFARNRRSGALRPLGGAAACIGPAVVPNCRTARGLSDLQDAAISPDGRHLYLIGSGPAAIAVLSRNARTGLLSQPPGSAGCLGSAQDSCGAGPPVDALASVETSPDGRHLYIAWLDGDEHRPSDHGLLWVARNRASGTLAPFTAPKCISAHGEHGCAKGPLRRAVDQLLLTPDGRHAYAALENGVMVAFRRNASAGALRPLAEPGTCSLAAGRHGCRPRGARPVGLAGSPDGQNLYYGLSDGDASLVAVLARRPASGELEQLSRQSACVGDEFAAGCARARGVDDIDCWRSVAMAETST